MVDFNAFTNSLSGQTEFQQHCSKVMDGKRLTCFDRQVPVEWLWHGGRLLPAVMWDVAKRSGCMEEIKRGLSTPTVMEYAYLSRGYTGDIKPYLSGCFEAVDSLLTYAYVFRGAKGQLLENVPADWLIQQFMEDVIHATQNPDDLWDWLCYRKLGKIPVGGIDPIRHDWMARTMPGYSTFSACA